MPDSKKHFEIVDAFISPYSNKAKFQSTSNYLARRYGVRAAMPGFIAKKLCPDLVIVPGNHEKYSAVSSQVMDVIGKVWQSSFRRTFLNMRKHFPPFQFPFHFHLSNFAVLEHQTLLKLLLHLFFFTTGLLSIPQNLAQ